MTADDEQPDRLEQIARRFARGDETPDDVEWLIAEARRLRAELAEDARPFGASEP